MPTDNDNNITPTDFITTTDNFTISTQTTCNPPRVYQLHIGDQFGIDERQAFNVLREHYTRFRPVERKKCSIWYKPWTWFRWIWILEVIE